MGQAREQFERYRGSAEKALSEVVPWIAKMQAYAARSAAAGKPMENSARSHAEHVLTMGPYAGHALDGSQETAQAAAHAVQAFRRVVELWDAAARPDGSCPATPEIIEALASVDGPLYQRWTSQGEANQAFQLELQPMLDAFAKERQAECAEQARLSLHPGAKITLFDYYGTPMSFLDVVSGSAEEGYALSDGRRIEFRLPAGEWMIPPTKKAVGVRAQLREPHDEAVMAMRRGRLLADGSVSAAALPILPDLGFVAGPADFDYWTFQPCDESLPVRPILDEVMPRGSYGELMAYMNRRFGPPTLSSDTYKTLCGGWVVSTPMPDMVLRVQPSAAGLEFSYRAFLRGDRAARLRELERGFHHGGAQDVQTCIDAVAPYAAALRTAICDMLRPVWERDVPLNALGLVRWNSPLLASGQTAEDKDDEDEQVPAFGVDYSQASTVGMPRGFFDDTTALGNLLEALEKLDPDDMARAMTRLAGMVSDKPGVDRAGKAGPLRLYVVGSDSASPGDWGDACDYTLVTAADADAARSQTRMPNAAVCEVPMDKPQILARVEEPTQDLSR